MGLGKNFRAFGNTSCDVRKLLNAAVYNAPGTAICSLDVRNDCNSFARDDHDSFTRDDYNRTHTVINSSHDLRAVHCVTYGVIRLIYGRFLANLQLN